MPNSDQGQPNSKLSPNASPKTKLPSNFNVLTFTTPCPACGATVEFASAGSVMAVCEYCQSSVIRQGEAVTAQGKQSLVVEDYSPLQIGSIGNFNNNQFVVVGRIQLQYSDGIWNEWFIQFSNGRNGWLSEALGQYSLTLGKGIQPDLPQYHSLSINSTINFEGDTYTVSDKRSAQAIAGEGELPFVMGKGWETWVVDARFKRKFITLDYAEQGVSGAPTVYKGISVSLEHLNMQMLKQDTQINQNAGLSGNFQDNSQNNTSDDDSEANNGNTPERKSSETTQLDCPNCGSPVDFVAGMTNCLICPSCHGEIKMTGNKAEVVKLNSMMQSLEFSLPLGAKARIKEVDIIEIKEFSDDSSDAKLSDTNISQKTEPNSDVLAANNKYHDYVVIGVMRLLEVGEVAYWTEYLLYSHTDGFLWLSEESSGWYVARVLNEFPTKRNSNLVYDGRVWMNYTGSYASSVTFAAGAFNWQVNTSDAMYLSDFRNGNQLITSEQNNEEITYTIASPISLEKMETWFGSQLQPIGMPTQFARSSNYDENGEWADYWDDDDDDEIPGNAYIQLLMGLIFSYFFFFVGSMGALVVNIIVCIVVFGIFTRLTRDDHQYSSITDVVSSVYHEKQALTIGISWIFVVAAVILNLLFFSPNHNSSGGHSSVYYSSDGREGYSSSGSHK